MSTKKRKVWVVCKNAKIPRTTAWRRVSKGTLIDCCLPSASDVLNADIGVDHLSSLPLPLDPNPSISNSRHDNQYDGNSVTELLSILTTTISDEYTVTDEESEACDSEGGEIYEDSEEGEIYEDSDSTCSESENGKRSDAEIDESMTDDRVPLYEGAAVSNLGAMIVVMLFTLKHKLAGTALIDLVKVLCALLPNGHKFVSSAYLLKKYFADRFGEPTPKTHAYCGNCLGRIRKNDTECSKRKCVNAKKKVEYFLELDLHCRLCQLFRDKEFVRLLGHRFDHDFLNDENICDVYSGLEYRKLFQSGGFLSKDNPLNISFSFNTDGVAPFKSSNRQNFWPIFLVINELPPKLRCSRKYMFLAGLWCSKKKPNMQTFCRPIIESISDLYINGLTVDMPSGKKQVKATLLLASADLPAKALMANMKQFNGEYGCSVCEDKGKLAGTSGLHRIWPYTSNMVLRTHQTVVASVKKMLETNKPVNGIKGASVFLLFKPFDLVKGFVVDWMHAVCLGVTKAMLNLWLNTENKGKDFFLGAKVALINKRLLSIKVPDIITRCPRSLSERGTWKATEYRNWLVHYSLPVLKGVLPEMYFIHYAMFVTGISILVSDSISPGQLLQAEELLDNFCKLMPELYGEKSQTHNLHLLRHLVYFVRHFGPLWVYSCFGFEALNGFLTTLIHGTQHISKQIAAAVSIYRNFPFLVAKMDNSTNSEKVMKLAKHLSGERSVCAPKTALNDCHTCVLGAAKREMLTKEELLATNRFLCCNGLPKNKERERVNIFSRASINCAIFNCSSLQKSKVKNSYTVEYNDISGQTQFGEISKFLELGSCHLAVINKLVLTGHAITSDVAASCKPLEKYDNCNVLAQHILLTKRSTYLACVPLSNIKKKCIAIGTFGNFGGIYVSRFPNMVEHD